MYLEWFLPNPGGSPDPIISRSDIKGPVLLSEREISWSEDTDSAAQPMVHTDYALNRFTGNLRITRPISPPVYPAGWDATYACQKRERAI